MRNPFQIVKYVAVAALLVGSATGLAVTSKAAPTGLGAASTVSFAANSLASICAICVGNGPSITAQNPSGGVGYITGTGFTQGGSVLVNVYGPSGAVISQVWTTGQTFCKVLCSPPGEIKVTNFNYPPCESSYTVRAYDVATARWSNTVSVAFIDCLT